MREMLATTAALVGQGLGKKVAMVTDDGSLAVREDLWWAMLPLRHMLEARLALVQNNDIITIDTLTNVIDLHVSKEELDKRKNRWSKPNQIIQQVLLQNMQHL